jgi:ABC-type multidrug transport system ATPase subunit/pSer/pThr/pTyr-binding forkhead associated (FHA) protein
MTFGFGKQSINIGSGPDSDIRLGGPGVKALHARIDRNSSGALTFTNLEGSQTRTEARALGKGEAHPFDFRTAFTLGEATPLPLTHPAITGLLLSRGQLPAHAGPLRLGRDPGQNDVVVQHPNVSGQHARLARSPIAISDSGSTSGTWLGKERLSKGAIVSLSPGALVALGPVPFAYTLLEELLQAFPEAHGAGAPQVSPPDDRAAAAALEATAQSPAVAAPGKGGGGARHKTVVGQFAVEPGGGQQTKTIGRSADNDIVVAHAQVSSRHALLHQAGAELFIEDKGSQNGTFVRGQRIPANQRIAVSHGEKVFIGPMPLRVQSAAREVAMVIEDAVSWEGRPLYEIEAWDLVLEVPDRDRAGQKKLLLDHVSFKALPGDFIALMGPSGSGKTTLLLTLNGYLRPTAGQVRINGEDLHSIYDALRGSIGYVPQDDIVHPELTVWEAVRYSAKFRLPPDYSEDEIDRRVTTTLQQLGLEGVKHLQIGKPEKKVLSGGQRKRVNIAMELVTDPVIMFLDEPTSGLAADDTTALVTLLADLAKQTGKTIITTIHQPAKDEFEKFNLTLVMGLGGVPIFFGPTHPDAYRFFGTWLERQGKPNTIDNPRDMFDMLNRREQPMFERLRASDPSITRQQARAATAREWNADFFNEKNPTFRAMFSGKRQVGAGSTDSQVPMRRPTTHGQFFYLLSRYFKIKQRDVAGSAIMLLQAPIIGVLLAIVFGGQKDVIPFWCLGAIQELAARSGEIGDGSNGILKNMQATPDNAVAIFFVTVAAVWFGTSNAAREIVSERAIYVRERMVNLGLFNYVVSKFVLLSLVTVIQCSVLLGIVFFALGFSGGLPAFGIGLVTLIATAMNSVAIGLTVSTIVVSSEAAMALTPIALIPQVVLGGLMVPMTTNPNLEPLMLIMPARWGFEGLAAQERLAVKNDPAWIIDLQRPTLNSLDNFITSGKFHCAEAQIASDNLNGAWGFTHFEAVGLPVAVLGAMMVVVLAITLMILKRRDSI